MPLNRDRRVLGKMDVQILIYAPTTERSSAGGPITTTSEYGPVWASREYLARKQMETEVATRITSFQQIKFVIRYTEEVAEVLSKAGHITLNDRSSDIYNIITVSKDMGRKQFIEIIAELKE